MLAPGSTAPDFSLPDQDGNTVSLGALLEDGPLILYFYPADFTPGCTKEACSLRDMQDDLLASGLRVVGVSPQDSASHQRFADKHKLGFTLLADTGKNAIKAYDVDGPLGFGVRRGSFLIGKDSRIIDAVLADFRIDRHDEFFRRAAQRAADG
ncbi:MAG: peroxiredoxin [Gammaproteobacteria bacterium]|nr:peroxiredoxin [Gammaproteobacteria bacterium]